MKKIYQVIKQGKQVKVFRNLEMREYLCRLYINGKANAEADYFTDCKQDAINTANAMVF